MKKGKWIEGLLSSKKVNPTAVMWFELNTNEKCKLIQKLWSHDNK